jgi:diguanylate cyclase (GGDEF)-like protein
VLLLPYQLTQAGLAFLGFGVFSLLWWRSARRCAPPKQRRLFHTLWGLALVGFLAAQAGGWFAGQRLLRIRIVQVQELIGGYAPTLASILTELGHERIRVGNPGYETVYNELLDRTTRWQRENHSIQALYTMRKEPSGQWHFVVSPSCDLDHNGLIQDVLEYSDTLGTPYDEPVPEMDTAWAGKLAFQNEPTEDAWGYSLSIFCPLRNAAGEVEAILGIDYDARLIRREMVTELLLFLSMLSLFQLFMAIFTLRLWSSQLETDRAQLEQTRMAKIASTDPLTGLANRRHLETRFERELQELAEPRHLCLIVFDIDRYKSINDTWGHEIGDRVLLELSRHLSDLLRSHDLFARWGGDEFAILLPNTSLDEAATLAVTLRKAVEQLEIRPVTSLTCSFGVAELREGETMTHLLRRADVGLYRAKEAGRNRVMTGG